MNDSILGCFIKIGFDPKLNRQDFMNMSKEFRPYIGGEKGISNTLKKLKYKDYGKDLELALFEFHVKPTLIEIQYLRKIGRYRKKEKSIGAPIIITDKNFFDKSEADRYAFLKQSIFDKLDLLEEVVKKKKLDTNMELLKSDLHKIWG